MILAKQTMYSYPSMLRQAVGQPVKMSPLCPNVVYDIETAGEMVSELTLQSNMLGIVQCQRDESLPAPCKSVTQCKDKIKKHHWLTNAEHTLEIYVFLLHLRVANTESNHNASVLLW